MFCVGEVDQLIHMLGMSTFGNWLKRENEFISLLGKKRKEEKRREEKRMYKERRGFTELSEQCDTHVTKKKRN